jgi:hypothetical protein
MRAGAEVEDGTKWVEQAFRFTTTNADTHPCLTDRLRALGRLPDNVTQAPFPAPPLAPEPNAAEILLGDSLQKIRADVERAWRKECEGVWRDRHARAASLHHRLASIDQTVPDSTTDVDGLWDKAHVLLDLRGAEAAEPLLRQILSFQPKHAAANFHLGRRLLEAGDAAGEAHLESAMAEAEELVPQACEELALYFRRTGRAERLRELAGRLDRYEKDLAASHAERRTVTAADSIIPHGLTESELGALREILNHEPDLVMAKLARKELRYFPNQRMFLLCVHLRPAWHHLPNRERERSLVSRLSSAVRLTGRVLVFSPSGSFRVLARRLGNVPGAVVFHR